MPRGGARPGAGRRPDAGAPRTETIPIRATESEKAELLDAAGAEGKDLSDYLREAGLERARR